MSSTSRNIIKSSQKKLNINIPTIINIDKIDHQNTSLSFPKDERLCSIIAITQLYATGKSVMGFPLRGTFVQVPSSADDLPQVKVLFTVSKKRFKRANKRNLLKRRMRESYRHLKGDFYAKLASQNIHLELSINYITNEELDYAAISKGMEKLLNKVIKSIESNPQPS